MYRAAFGVVASASARRARATGWRPRPRRRPTARAPRAALRRGRVRQGVLEDGPVVVLVVAVPPHVGLRLRVALRRVLPDLLAPERGDVQVVPGVAHLLVAALVDEVRAEDPVVLVAE